MRLTGCPGRGTSTWVFGVLLGCMSVGGASLSVAQDTSVSPVRLNRPTHIRRGLNAQTQAELAPVFARAQDRGLPVDALTAKAAEGALRGVPSSRIIVAVRALEERLTTAKLALTPTVFTGDIVAGADALAVGVSVDVLRAVRQRRPQASVAVPLAVLAQLVSQGVPTNRATSIVLNLIERGATSKQLVGLREAVNDAILAGSSASRALDAQAAHVLAAMGPHPNSNMPMTGTAIVSGTASQASQTTTLSGHKP